MDYERSDENSEEKEEIKRDPSFDADDIMNSAVDETPDVFGGGEWDGEDPDLSELEQPEDEDSEYGGDSDDSSDDYEDQGEIRDDIADDEPYSEDGEYPDADSYDQDDIDEAMEESGEDTATDEDIDKFVAVEKESYETVSEKKPGKLNKKIILNTFVIIGAALFLFTMFMPESCKQSKNRDAKKNGKAEDVTLQDFRSMVPQNDKSSGRDARPKGKKKPPVLGADGHWYDEDGNIVDDEVNMGVYGDLGQNDTEYADEQQVQQQTTQTAQTAGSGGGGGDERPDTRGDALQVGITGIKGLTGSRGNYATDYEETRIANAAAADPGIKKYELPDINSMTNAVLSTVNQSSGMTSYKTQNDQAGKQSFHTAGAESTGQGEWRPRNSLWEGSVFEAELTTALNTDIPGEITARVTKNVYSSQTGEYLLIPQNSIIYGTYNSSISYAQSRVQIAWNKIIRPDGYVINLGNFNAVDRHGAAGVKGFVNDHPLAYLKAIAVMSVFNIINKEFESSMAGTNNEYVENVMANSQQVANTLGEKLIDRAMDVQPTITKPVGTIVYVLTNQPLTLPPVQTPPVTQPYQKKFSWQK